MSSVTVTGDRLSVRFSRLEKAVGWMHDVDVPLDDVASAAAVDDGVVPLRGFRSPGLGLPSHKVGTWRRRGHRTYVAVRRGEPALWVHLARPAHRSLLVGTPDAAALAERIDGDTASRG